MHAVLAEDEERVRVGGVDMNHLAQHRVVTPSGAIALIPVRQTARESVRQLAWLGQGLHGIRVVLVPNTSLEDVDCVVEGEKVAFPDDVVEGDKVEAVPCSTKKQVIRGRSCLPNF